MVRIHHDPPIQYSKAFGVVSDDGIGGYMGIAYDVTERLRRDTRHVAHHDVGMMLFGILLLPGITFA